MRSSFIDLCIHLDLIELDIIIMRTYPIYTHSVNRQLQKRQLRQRHYRRQRFERGFDDTEVVSLDDTIVMFALPRLKVLRQKTFSYPFALESMEEWQLILDKMILGLEKYLEDTSDEQAVEGIELFLKWFQHLGI